MIAAVSTAFAEPVAGPDGRRSTDAARRAPVVHIVDDDEAIRDSLSFLLDVAGFAIRVYPSAAAFLRALPLPAGDCLITDVRMPGITGLELMAALRGMGATLPVIVMTGHGDFDLARRAIRVGAADFIEKPFDEPAMIRAVEAVLAHG